jgi:hypothetical protein
MTLFEPTARPIFYGKIDIRHHSIESTFSITFFLFNIKTSQTASMNFINALAL